MTNNHTEIRRLLGLTFEIEGLLMLAERRDDMTPAEIYSMLKDKCSNLLAGISAMTDTSVDTVAEPAPEEVIQEEDTAEETADNEAITESVAFEETSDADVNDVAEPTAPAPAAPEETPAASRAIVLTLNDKFRFRRTLFGGSDAQMADTLAILSGLTDTDDLNDFITNDLCWDTDDPDVIDFLAVVAAAR